jgi:hypothetical protein
MQQSVAADLRMIAALPDYAQTESWKMRRIINPFIWLPFAAANTNPEELNPQAVSMK